MRIVCLRLIFNVFYEYMSIDWTKIYKKYPGMWVAFEKDEQTVIGCGKTAREAFEKAQDHGIKEPILTHMPKNLISYVGHGQGV